MVKRQIFHLQHILLISIGLYFIFTTSLFVRYWVDDFCSAAFLRDNGFFGAQLGWWNSWTGRYSSVFFTDIFELIGPWVVRFLPFLLLFLLIVTVVPLFYFDAIFASTFIVLTLVNAPNIIQSFYWQTGSLNYTTPFIFLNLFLSLHVMKGKKTFPIIAFLLMFIAGGFSEALALSGVVVCGFLIIGLLILNPKNKKHLLNLSLAGFFGLVVSLVIMSLSPGNAARALTVTRPESLSFVIKSTTLGTKWYLLRFISIKPFLYSLVIIFSSTIFLSKKIKITQRKTLTLIVLSLLMIPFATMAVIGSGYYSMSTLPPERALYIVVYVILLSFFIFSILVNNLIRNFISSKNMANLLSALIVINLIFIVLVARDTITHWSRVRSEVRDYAISWDQEVKNLPNIKNIPAVGGLDSFTDNKGWVSGCVANYYGFKNVKITE